ncbi:type II secretion system protein [Candidatus Parcubacteria bacterium]|jgi:prepilin-type N-terminal cleavage/methylation domain-containing protein|nr:type II secretion system protein [Candidatus Parcubacteria bacterium]
MICYSFVDNLKNKVSAVFVNKNSVSFVNGKQGFTLIELVITIGVFTLGIIGAFTLALANFNTAKENVQRVLAANLAREGIEMVRNVRDSNWLRIDSNADCNAAAGIQLCDWDEYLQPGGNSDIFFIINYNSNPIVECSVSSNIDDCIEYCSSDILPGNNNNNCGLYLNNGFYHHDDIGVPSGMYRVIQVQSICLSGSTETPTNSMVCNVGEKIGIRVISRVSWLKGNALSHLDVVEDMYNWRR